MGLFSRWLGWVVIIFIGWSGGIAAVSTASAALETTKPLVVPTEPRYLPYFKLGGTRYFHGDSSAAQSYNFFLPLTQTPQQLLFADLRIFQRSGGSSEGNFQLGWRKIYRPDQAMFAIYGSWDLRKSIHDNLFHQVVIGGEHWYQNWFMGANYYLPVGPTQQSIGLPYYTIQRQTDFAKLRHFDTIQIWQDCERSQRGYDGEVGYAFTSQLTGYLGGYHFSNNHTPSTTGPRFRLTYDHFPQHGRLLGILDGVSLEAGVQHDRPRGTIGYLSLSLKIGMTNFNNRNSNLTGFDRHLVELLRRDPDIVVQRAAQLAIATLRLKHWFTEEECQEYFAKVKKMSDEELYFVLGIPVGTTYEQLLQTHAQKVINWLAKPKTQRRDQKMLFWMAKFYPLLSYYPSGNYTEGMAELNFYYQQYFFQNPPNPEKSAALTKVPVNFTTVSPLFASPSTLIIERLTAPPPNPPLNRSFKKTQTGDFKLLEQALIAAVKRGRALQLGLGRLTKRIIPPPRIDQPKNLVDGEAPSRSNSETSLACSQNHDSGTVDQPYRREQLTKTQNQSLPNPETSPIISQNRDLEEAAISAQIITMENAQVVQTWISSTTIAQLGMAILLILHNYYWGDGLRMMLNGGEADIPQIEQDLPKFSLDHYLEQLSLDLNLTHPWLSFFVNSSRVGGAVRELFSCLACWSVKSGILKLVGYRHKITLMDKIGAGLVSKPLEHVIQEKPLVKLWIPLTTSVANNLISRFLTPIAEHHVQGAANIVNQLLIFVPKQHAQKYAVNMAEGLMQMLTAGGVAGLAGEDIGVAMNVRLAEKTISLTLRLMVLPMLTKIIVDPLRTDFPMAANLVEWGITALGGILEYEAIELLYNKLLGRAVRNYCSKTDAPKVQISAEFSNAVAENI